MPRYGDKGLSWPRLEPVQRATGSQAGKFERPLTEFLSHLTTKEKEGFANEIKLAIIKVKSYRRKAKGDVKMLSDS